MSDDVQQVQRLPAWSPDGRPETGPMAFGDDWPGVFIRGDNALMYANALDHFLTNTALKSRQGWARAAVLEGLRDLLRSCSVGDTGWPPRVSAEQTPQGEDNG